MTKFETIKNADIEKMSKIIFAIEHSILNVPKKYGCDLNECFDKKCVDCYIEWLKSEDTDDKRGIKDVK